jgi:3-oxoacyl-[acyl-carrier-protein] synthase III
MTANTEIISLGHYAPDNRVTNAEIEARLGLDEGWIVRRTGIEARRYAAPDEALSDLAIKAGDMALANAGIKRSEVALLLLATSTPDHLLPPTAPLVAHKLGMRSAGGIDMAGACAGFIYALTMANSFAMTQQAPVLVIAANILSRRINASDRNTSILFADAAGAVVVAPTMRKDCGVLGTHLTTDGSAYDMIQIPGGGSRKPFAALKDASETLMLIANGKAVFAKAVAMMTNSAQSALSRAGLNAADVTHFIPHQANARMMAAVAEQLKIPKDRMRATIAEFGNSSAATIPFTLSHAAEQGLLTRGDIVLMTAAGAGLTGGAAVVRY